MTTFFGIDVAKEMHGVCAIDPGGKMLINRRLPNSPEHLQPLVGELQALPAPCRAGIDVLGGIASTTQAVLLQAGFELVRVSGLAVNRARTRTDLRPVTAQSELDIELRLLVSRRGDLRTGKTRRLARMYDLLVGIFPELEHALDLPRKRRAAPSFLDPHGGRAGRSPALGALTSKTALVLPSQFVTPLELRQASDEQLHQALGTLANRSRARKLIDAARSVAARQTSALIRSLPGMEA